MISRARPWPRSATSASRDSDHSAVSSGSESMFETEYGSWSLTVNVNLSLLGCRDHSTSVVPVHGFHTILQPTESETRHLPAEGSGCPVEEYTGYLGLAGTVLAGRK